MIQLQDNQEGYCVALPPIDCSAFALPDHEPELKEREIRLILPGGKLDHELVILLVKAEEKAVRQRFDLSLDETELILIGKDGGEKERIGKVDLPFIFDAVDRMPMRQAEMRRQRGRD